MLKVISLWAGPGAGKSTTAAALFNLMKRERFEVELVTEVAKDWTTSATSDSATNSLSSPSSTGGWSASRAKSSGW